jgi:CO/xanthine dehydrogenase FAD-binding subunit
MRGFVPDYELKTLPSLSQTLQTLEKEPTQWKVFAGGTDLMVLFEAGKLAHHRFLNLAPFSELKQIEESGGDLKIGALCTYTQIQNHPVIQKEFPLLARSGWVTGAKAIQNRGTIGGNIANASPAADTPPSLFAYGAKIELMSSQGTRKLDYSQFHLDYKKTAIRDDEVISAVLVPRNQGWTHQYYRKVGTRAFQSISKVAISAAAQIERGMIQKIRIGLASVGPTPMRAQGVEKTLLQQDISVIRADSVIPSLHHSLAPIGDVRSTAAYRKVVLERVTKHLLDVLKGAPGLYLE